jgi:hypothetical protein
MRRPAAHARFALISNLSVVLLFSPAGFIGQSNAGSAVPTDAPYKNTKLPVDKRVSWAATANSSQKDST